MTFSCSCDSIGEYGRIDSRQKVIQHRFDRHVEYLLILDKLVKHFIELEWSLFVLWLADSNEPIVHDPDSHFIPTRLYFFVV